jgi:hypothetical protein
MYKKRRITYFIWFPISEANTSKLSPKSFVLEESGSALPKSLQITLLLRMEQLVFKKTGYAVIGTVKIEFRAGFGVGYWFDF